jgi:hypothetical protein
MFNNPLALLIGLRTLNNNKKIDKSDRNKALLFPLFIKDPTGAVLAADLAAKKAVNEADLKDVTTELNINKNLSNASLQIIEEATSALKNIETALAPDVVNVMNAAELRKHISDNITPHLNIQLTKDVRDAIISARPDLSPVAPRRASDLSGVKGLLNAPVN